MAKIISVVNQKGGTGKFACAANLGVGLALMNKNTLAYWDIENICFQLGARLKTVSNH